MSRSERQKAGVQSVRSKEAPSQPDPQSSNPTEHRSEENAIGGFGLHSFLTMEIAVYVAAGILGFCLRLLLLGSFPLEASESMRALSAWQLVRFEPPANWADPLVTMFTMISFFLFGANDVVARLGSVLVGASMVLAPWFLRKQIGRVGALSAALFIALSPTLILYSRTLSSDIFSSTIFLFLVGVVFNWRNTQRHLLVFGGLLGLLFASGPSAITYLIAGLLSLVVYISVSGNWEGTVERARENLRRLNGNLLIAIGMFACVLIIITTAFFTRLDGFAFLNLSGWLVQFEITANSSPWYFPLAALVLYEPALVLLGLAGLFFGVRQMLATPLNKGFVGLLLLELTWIVAALVLAFNVGEKSGSQTLVVLLPLILSGGYFIQAVSSEFTVESLLKGGRSALLVLPLLVFVGLLMNQFSNAGSSVSPYQWGLLVFSVFVTVGSTVIAVGQNKWGNTATVAVVGAMVVIPYWVHTNSWLNYRPSGSEILPTAIASRAVQDSVESIRTMIIASGSDRDFAILIDEGFRYPFAWYLRDEKNVTYSSNVVPGATIVVATDNDKARLGFDDYLAMKTRISSRSSVSSLFSDRIWRWIIQRETIGEPTSLKAITYIK